MIRAGFSQFEQQVAYDKNGLGFRFVRLDEILSDEDRLQRIEAIANPLAKSPERIVYGLYVLFNSTLYDCYYRILNGSTQVNSTEINSMPVPPLESIEQMGKALIKSRDMTESGCDQILRSFIYEQNRGSKRDTERIESAS